VKAKPHYRWSYYVNCWLLVNWRAGFPLSIKGGAT